MVNNKFKITEKSDIFKNYLKLLTDKIYKILPLFEEENEGLFSYVQSLIYELNGTLWAIEELQKNAEYISLIATLESLSNDSIAFDNDHYIIKREVFKCIDIVKKMRNSESGDA